MGKPDAWKLRFKNDDGAILHLVYEQEHDARADLNAVDHAIAPIIPLYAIDDETREALHIAMAHISNSDVLSIGAQDKHIAALESLLSQSKDAGTG